MAAWIGDELPPPSTSSLRVYEELWDDDDWRVTAELLRLKEQAEFMRTILVVVAIAALILLGALVAPIN